MGEHDSYGRDKFPPSQLLHGSRYRSDTPPWAIALHIEMECRFGEIMATQAEIVAKLTTLTQGVAVQTTVIDSLDVLLTNLSKMITDLRQQVANADVPQVIADQIDAIGAAVSANKDRIAADVTKNTPTA